MGDGTTTDLAQMAEFRSDAMASADSLESMLRGLMNGLEPLAKWIGQGGTAFASTQQVVNHETTQLTNALNGIAVDIGSAGQAYAASDAEQGASMFKVEALASGISRGLKA